jgi:hypothetical protein
MGNHRLLIVFIRGETTRAKLYRIQGRPSIARARYLQKPNQVDKK